MTRGYLAVHISSLLEMLNEQQDKQKNTSRFTNLMAPRSDIPSKVIPLQSGIPRLGGLPTTKVEVHLAPPQ